MELHTFEYDPSAGWSVDAFPEWDSPQTLVLVFGDLRYLDDRAPIDALSAAYPQSIFGGCSTAGEIIGIRVQQGTLAVAVVRFASTRLRAATASVAVSEQSRSTAASLAASLSAPDLKGVLVFSDGLHVNGSQLVAGFNDVFQGAVTVTGGLAGDGYRFQRTWVFGESGPTPEVVTAIGLYGERVRIGYGSRGGWDIFGPERRVTRSVGNVLYALDGRPALALYKDYLGEMAAGLPATALRFPLALRADATSGKRLVRTVLSVSDQDGSLTFAGDVPEGYLAQLMCTNLEHLIDGAEDAALMTKNRGADREPLLAIAISCVGRRMVLGERVEDEVEVTLDALPPSTSQIGYYSYGEIAPYGPGACDLHNQTMTLTTLHEV